MSKITPFWIFRDVTSRFWKTWGRRPAGISDITGGGLKLWIAGI
jgi:hypothetical protein